MTTTEPVRIPAELAADRRRRIEAAPADGEVHHTICRICESLCGLEVTVADGRITRIRRHLGFGEQLFA